MNTSQNGLPTMQIALPKQAIPMVAAQVELTFFLVTHPSQYEFRREQNPYDDATFEIDI
jgi:hypothetical protein